MAFMDYFPLAVEYPEPADQPLKRGLLFSYISSTFLDGWINYVEMKRAWLITRYRAHAENVAKLAAFHADTPIHPNLGALGDDVFILARSKRGDWWFFWYDCDVSDCCIGILSPWKDTDEQVLEAFDKFAADRHGRENGAAEHHPPLPIDVSKLRGWVRW